jgi:hypothetical protein
MKKEDDSEIILEIESPEIEAMSIKDFQDMLNEAIEPLKLSINKLTTSIRYYNEYIDNKINSTSYEKHLAVKKCE